MSKFVETMKSISPRAALQLAVSHVFLLVGCIAGGVPYLVLQGLLAVELLLLSVATVVLYPARGVGRHLWDLVKLSGTLLFVMFFLVVTYAVAAGRHGDATLQVAAAQARDLDTRAIAFAIAYIVGTLAFALWKAFRSDDPRLSWSKSQLGNGGATFVAMFFMVFAAVFVAQPLLGFARTLGIPANVDTVLGVLMVLLRYFTALVVSTFSESDWREVSTQPYVDGPARSRS